MESEQNHLAGWLPALANLTAAVNRNTTLDELLNKVAKIPCDLMGYDFCAVMLPDESHSVLLIRGSHGLSESYIQHVNDAYPILLETDLLASPSSQAFTTATARQVVDILNSPDFAPWGGVAREQGFASMISMPLLAGEKTLGTLNCYTRTQHEAGRDEIELLSMLADQAANAILTAKLQRSQTRTIRRLNDLNEKLTLQRDLQRRSSETHERFTTVALEGGGIPAVASSLAALLNRSVVVRDVYGELLHYAERAGEQLPGLLTVDQWDTEDQLDLSKGRAGEISVMTVSDIPVLRMPIMLQEEVAAWVWVSPSSEEVAEFDRQAIEHAGTVLALELLRNRAVAEEAWRGSEEILAALLSTDQQVPASLLERSIRLGHDLKVPHTVNVMRTPNARDGLPQHRIASVFSRWADQEGPRPLIGQREGFLVVLWPEPKAQNVQWRRKNSEQVRRTLQHPSSRGMPTVTAVIGPIENLTHYPSAFAAAVGAVELASLDGVTDRTIMLEDLELAGLLLQLPNTHSLSQFIRTTVGALEDYDAHYQTELLLTLRYLMRHDFNTAEISKEMHLHKNTITQRRRRIEELLKVDLRSTQAIANITVALRLLEIAQVRIN